MQAIPINQQQTEFVRGQSSSPTIVWRIVSFYVGTAFGFTRMQPHTIEHTGT